MIDQFIFVRPNCYHSLIDGRNFLVHKRVPREVALQRCREHVASIIAKQDGNTYYPRTLNERKNIFLATTAP